ncbi:hypothetical protein B9Z55_017171 [Caenorhabditis nigoni]|uniref:Uncharacterized protein n=1 Tax=Caenorhabditis nigoni TaxID=1611254 RepID=A0A2G5T7W6_9PELO|nr:hypothetical protein B9Z55_017171 [Caenorhabditis nigoni]
MFYETSSFISGQNRYIKADESTNFIEIKLKQTLKKRDEELKKAREEKNRLERELKKRVQYEKERIQTGVDEKLNERMKDFKDSGNSEKSESADSWESPKPTNDLDQIEVRKTLLDLFDLIHEMREKNKELEFLAEQRNKWTEKFFEENQSLVPKMKIDLNPISLPEKVLEFVKNLKPIEEDEQLKESEVLQLRAEEIKFFESLV